MKRIAIGIILAWMVAPGQGAEPITLTNLPPLSANQKDEPLARVFSLEAAGRFLDTAALNWQKQKNCFACHTNYAYLTARPAIPGQAPAQDIVRKFAEEHVQQRWEKDGPRWDAEVVAMAAALAFNDAATTGKLHPLTRKALDRMWTVQRPDGGWKWLKCNWPPMESDDHYGATLAALAVAVAPDHYAQTEAAKKGLENIRRYFKANPPKMLHHEAMLLWVSTSLDGFLSAAEKKAIVDKLLALQKADGGWAVATLGQWQRADKKEQDTQTSDGYATGFCLYVLRRAGLPANDARIQKGVAWLKKNQRASGRWFTRSLRSDGKHYLSHAGTAFAVLALKECEPK